jgi:hypothetical protein
MISVKYKAGSPASLIHLMFTALNHTIARNRLPSVYLQQIACQGEGQKLLSFCSRCAPLRQLHMKSGRSNSN